MEAKSSVLAAHGCLITRRCFFELSSVAEALVREQQPAVNPSMEAKSNVRAAHGCFITY